MVYLPSGYREITPLDLLSWVFENNGVDPEKDVRKCLSQYTWHQKLILLQILIDAANTQNRFNTRQATSLVRKLIAGFKAAGLKLGDVVCVHAFNSILYPILYFGIIGAGGVLVGLNPAYKTLELRHLVSTTEPKLVVVEAELLDDALPVFASSTALARTFVLGTDLTSRSIKGFGCWSDLLQHGEQDWRRISDTETAKSTIAVLQSTSGTTGLPKVAATSHYALVASGVAMRESQSRTYGNHTTHLPALVPFIRCFVCTNFCVPLWRTYVYPA